MFSEVGPVPIPDHIASFTLCNDLRRYHSFVTASLSLHYCSPSSSMLFPSSPTPVLTLQDIAKLIRFCGSTLASFHLSPDALVVVTFLNRSPAQTSQLREPLKYISPMLTDCQQIREKINRPKWCPSVASTEGRIREAAFDMTFSFHRFMSNHPFFQ